MRSAVGVSRTLAPPAARAGWLRRRSARRALTFYLLVSPWLVGFVLLGALPLALGFLMSLTNYDGLNLEFVRFVGFENYLAILSDEDALHSLQRTLIFLVVVPIGVTLQVALAFLVNERIPVRSFFRALFYLPYVMPVVAGAWVWKTAMGSNGLFNALVSVVRPDTYVNWLVERPMEVLALFTLWAAAGGGMVISLAGLQGIPTEYREAAMIDGASRLQVARYVTLPLLTPVILFQLILGVIVTLQILVQPMLIAPGVPGGGVSVGTIPPRDNYLYVVHAYTEIFINQRFGYGAALLWVLFAVVLVLTLAILRSSRRWVHYEVRQ